MEELQFLGGGRITGYQRTVSCLGRYPEKAAGAHRALNPHGLCQLTAKDLLIQQRIYKCPLISVEVWVA